jgi:hypothetical protein
VRAYADFAELISREYDIEPSARQPGADRPRPDLATVLDSPFA